MPFRPMALGERYVRLWQILLQKDFACAPERATLIQNQVPIHNARGREGVQVKEDLEAGSGLSSDVGNPGRMACWSQHGVVPDRPIKAWYGPTIRCGVSG
jgi:hypothetical protein